MRTAITAGASALLVFTLLDAQAPPAPSAQPLLRLDDLTYQGAFRLPRVDEGAYGWGGSALSIRPDGTTMVVVGHDQKQWVGEVRIPTPGLAAALSDLPTADNLITPRDVLRGQLRTISPGSTNLLRIGGTMPTPDGGLVVTAIDTYDAALIQKAGHFLVSPDGQTVALQAVGRPGFTAGWMVPVPSEWQPLLGAAMLTGQCCQSIISRTSNGPSLSTWQNFPRAQATTQLLLGYPIDHQTIGTWEQPSQLMHGATVMRGGAVWPAGTRSVLFFGRFGSNYCYGGGVDDRSLHGTKDPASGHTRCYDPLFPYQGSHAYPYQTRVWAYDANELLAVRRGRKDPWEVRPYAVWELTYPHATDHREPLGSTYDPATKRLYVSLDHGDGDHPLIHVWRVEAAAPALASAAPPPPPTSASSSAPEPALTRASPRFAVAAKPSVASFTVSFERESDARLSTGDWALQVQRRADPAQPWVDHGRRRAAEPFDVSADLPCGPTYEFRAVWTKRGATPITIDLGTRSCVP